MRSNASHLSPTIRSSMYTNTTKDPDPVSRFIPLCYPRFPTSLKKKKNPITNPRTGYRQPSFVSRSLAHSLDPKKNATECPTTPTQNADTIKKTPFDRQCRPDFPKTRRQTKESSKETTQKDSTREQKGETALSQLLHDSHDGNAESR